MADIPDYTKGSDFKNNFTVGSSPINDFEFTDALTHDQQYEVDSPGIYRSDNFRSSSGEDRIQLAALNELGAEQGGVYNYFNNNLNTAFTLGSFLFYDGTEDENLTALIQQSVAGILGLSATQIQLIVSSQLVFDGIPTSNPGGSGRVWNNGGVLNIT